MTTEKNEEEHVDVDLASCPFCDEDERDKKKDDKCGNTAAMREALEYCLDFIMRLDRTFNPYMQQRLETAVSKARDAISMPARNCDRFGGNKDRLIEACMRERGLLVDENFKEVFSDWLLEPYKTKD